MTIKVKWERADGRRQAMVTAPLLVEVGGAWVRAREWGIGGLTVPDPAGALPVSEQARPLRLSLPFQGFDIAFPVTARVTSRDAATGLATLELTALGERERELMCHFLDELVRGNMTGVGDTIRRLDSPVEPLKLEPDAHILPETTPPRRAISTGTMTAIYALLGLALLGTLGSIIHGRLFHFEVENAVVALPTEVLEARVDGQLLWGDVKPGQPVRAGDIVARISDDKLEHDIDLAQVAVREREARLELLKRLTPFRQHSSVAQRANSISRTKLDIDSLNARLQAAEQELRRVSAQARFASRAEEVKKRILALQKTIESRQLELQTQLERERTGTGDPTASDAMTAQAVHEAEFARMRHQTLVAHRDRLVLRAPIGGVLASLPRSDRSLVRRGETVAVIEQQSAPQGTAFLSPGDALRIAIGDNARLYVPSTGESMGARITRIDRGLAVGREPPAGASLAARTGIDPLARVTLALDRPDLVALVQGHGVGVPVVVRFERHWANSVTASLGTRLRAMASSTREGIARAFSGASRHAATRP